MLGNFFLIENSCIELQQAHRGNKNMWRIAHFYPPTRSNSNSGLKKKKTLSTIDCKFLKVQILSSSDAQK
jgi:hypothetical protein